jgi:SAM-dependent methyltransferase
VRTGGLAQLRCLSAAKIERLVGIRKLLKWTVGIVFPRNAIPGNIIKGLPIRDQSAAAVFCSHVLEHLPRDDMASALRNTFRMLRPGGLFRLVVPDLQWRAARYIRSAEGRDPTAADAFMQSCSLGRRSTPKGFIAWAGRCFGSSAHQWMYDFSALKMLLEEAGFIGVRRCGLGDCNDPKFALVEETNRFFDSGERELAIQAKRPETPAKLV